MELPARPLVDQLRDHGLDLNHWNILIHNFKTADPTLFLAELEPLLREMPQPDMTRLLCDADMLNLGLFARRFGPETGDFNWKPRLDPDPEALDFGGKIRPAQLIAIARPLFTLRFLGRPEWCSALANALDRDPPVSSLSR